MSRPLRSVGTLLTGVGIVVALAFGAQPAGAAMCIELSTQPKYPVERSPANVFAKDIWGGLDGNVFELVARRSDAADIPIRLSRASGDSRIWAGEVLFPTPGSWKLRVAGATPDNHTPCFETTVTVLAVGETPPRGGDPTSVMPLTLAALGLIAFAAAFLGVRRQRRRAAAGPSA